jgi:hypothetical protein
MCSGSQKSDHKTTILNLNKNNNEQIQQHSPQILKYALESDTFLATIEETKLIQIRDMKMRV